ncbi:MAG: ABC transporter ATP-binding protein [Clostridiales bacterium]
MILKTMGLSKTYGEGENIVKALQPTNITISNGEFTAIIGESGSGKSTLLHLIGGLDTPTSGKVIIDGKEIFILSENKLSELRRRNIGFIFQFFNLIPVLTVEENITLPLTFEGDIVDKQYIGELIEFLGIKDRIHHLPNELSGGQQQRVGIARALANKPSIILADEPTGNLDSKTSKEVLELLRRTIKKYKQTLVMITHDEKVASLADRIITLEDGNVINDMVVK